MKTRVQKQFNQTDGFVRYKAAAWNQYVLEIEFFLTIDEAYQWCADVVTMYEHEGMA